MAAVPARRCARAHASLDFDLPLDDYDDELSCEPPAPPPSARELPKSPTHAMHSEDAGAPADGSDIASALPLNNLLDDSAIAARPDADPVEAKKLSELLARVQFTELDDADDTESTDDERRQPHRVLHARYCAPNGRAANGRNPSNADHANSGSHDGEEAEHAVVNGDEDDDSWFGGIHFTREQYNSPLPRLPSVSKMRAKAEREAIEAAEAIALRANGGDAACPMCARLATENHRLRRLLDEADFHVAAAQAERRSRSRSDSSSSANSWRSSLNARRAKQAERSRLRAELNALAVTTEFLWRKLNTTERELADLRAAGVRWRSAPVERDGVDEIPSGFDSVDVLNRAFGPY